MKLRLREMLSKITPDNTHKETEWGEDVGKEKLSQTMYERLLPNLLPCEIERGNKIEEEVEWEEGTGCPECGDRMFWDKWAKNKKRLLCRSWIYMEGGC